MKKYHETESFRHLVKGLRKQEKYPVLNFRGTVKLHGSNLGIHYYNGNLQSQSRNQQISVDSDNYGFAKFIEDNRDIIEKAFAAFSVLHNTSDFTVYGEWIGPGIQKKVAIANLPTKQWVIFSAWNGETNSYIDVSESLNTLILPDIGIHCVYEIPTYNIRIDFSNPSDALETLQKYTDEVEKQCPWAAKFGIRGIGEGIVWTCVENYSNSDLWFKTKGEEHKRGNDKTKSKIEVDPIIAKKYEDFIDQILPEDRLYQGLEYLKEMNLEIDRKNTGEYLKWINKDILKEEDDLIEESDFEWKQLSGQVSKKARQFFLQQVDSI